MSTPGDLTFLERRHHGPKAQPRTNIAKPIKVDPSSLAPNRSQELTAFERTNSTTPLFGQPCRSWDRDEIEEILDYFQVDHSRTKKKTSLFDLLYHRVVQDRGVDELTIPAKRLLRFINRDDGVASQPVIGRKPTDFGLGSARIAANGRKNEVRRVLRERGEGSKASQSVSPKGSSSEAPAEDCEVCATVLLRTVNTPWRRITSSCVHESTICLTCLQHHIQNQLAMNTWDMITCPMCNERLSPDDIKAWSAPEFFERYGRISVQQVVHNGLTFRWCVVADCQNGFLCDPKSESYVVCDVCGRVTCLSCNVEYHSGISCKDFQYHKAANEKDALAKKKRSKQEQRSMEAIARVSVKCPRERCGAPIQKSVGCDHMRCVYRNSLTDGS
jgi:hypothetical protein